MRCRNVTALHSYSLVVLKPSASIWCGRALGLDVSNSLSIYCQLWIIEPVAAETPARLDKFQC